MQGCLTPGCTSDPGAPPTLPLLPALQGREILQSTVDLVQGSVGREVRLLEG